MPNALAASLALASAVSLPFGQAEPTLPHDLESAQVLGGYAAEGVSDLPTAHQWAADPSVPVVILGARLNGDCTPPQILEDRLDRAASFLFPHPLNKVVVTGGATQPGCASEGQAMADGLVARGVAPDRILIEDRAGSTVENAANVAALLPGSDRMVVVSNYDHLHRAKGNFAAVGVQAVGAALF